MAERVAEQVLADPGLVARIDVGDRVHYIRATPEGWTDCERIRALKGREPIYRRDRLSADALRRLCRQYDADICALAECGWVFQQVDYDSSVGTYRMGPDADDAVSGGGR